MPLIPRALLSLGLNRILRVLALAVIAAAAPVAGAWAEVVVAVAGPATGVAGAITDATLNGARRAAERINGAGGLNGEKISVERHDDGCEAAKATTLATALAARKVALVLGHACTSAALAAAKIYTAKPVLYIATASRHAAITSQRHTPKSSTPQSTPPQNSSAATSGTLPTVTTLLRLSGRDDKQGDDAARYLAANAKTGKIAIVHDRTRYARLVAEQAEVVLAKMKLPAPITATLIASEKDFPLVTAKIKDAAVIFYAGFPLEAGMLHAQLRAAGSKAVFVMSDSNATAEFTNTFGPSALGVRVMRPRFGLDDAPHDAADARQREAARNLADAAVEMTATAAREAGSADAEKIARLLHTRPSLTAAGTFTFEANGDAKRPSFDIYTWTAKDNTSKTETGAASGASWQRAD